MADNYTSEEIDAAVTKLVRESIRRPYGKLGTRELGVTFNDMQDAAAGVFLTVPAAPYYAIFLATERATASVNTAIGLAGDMLSAIDALNRRVDPINSLSSLTNARVALDALGSASASREQGFNDIEAVPAFQRYMTNTQKFLDDSSSNVRVNGEIVSTPQEARDALPGILRDLTAAHSKVIDEIGWLSVALQDYEDLNLGPLLMEGIVANAREVLNGRIEELEALEPDERNTVIRDVTLDLLAGRATVQGFGSITAPTLFALLEGEGGVYTDENLVGTPARYTHFQTGPYVVLPGADELDFLVDIDQAPVSLVIPHSYVAAIESLVPEPYTFYGTGNPHPDAPVIDPSNYVLNFEISGEDDLTVTLTQATGVSIDTVVAEINAAVTTQPVVAEPYFLPLKYSGQVDIAAVNLIEADFTFTAAGQDWTALTITPGEKLYILDPLSLDYTAVYSVDSVTATTIRGTKLSGGVGPGPVQTEAGIFVEIGGPARSLRLRITDAEAESSLYAHQSITVVEVADSAAPTFGLVDNLQSRSLQTTVDDIITAVNQSYAATVNGVARVRADKTFVQYGATIPARCHTTPEDPTRLSLYTWRGKVDVVGAGTSGSGELLGTIDGDDSIVNTNYRIVFRDGANAGIDARITSYDSETKTFNLASISGGSLVDSLDSTADVGLIFQRPRNTVIVIQGDTLNDGEYLVQEAIYPFDHIVSPSIPHYANVGGLPYYSDVDVGFYRLDILSTSDQIDSRLQYDENSSANDYFSQELAVTDPVYGSTPYVTIPSDPRTLELDDTLEFYDEDASEDATYLVPAEVSTLVDLAMGELRVTVSPEVSNERGTFQYSNSSPVPFVRIRKHLKQNYDELKAELDEWLTNPVNSRSYYTDLHRYVNDVLANTNPTLSSVNTLKTHLGSLVTALNDALAALAVYEVEPQPIVDALVESFNEKGADYAVDVLLSARFSTFFGLTQEETSYLGQATAAMREVNREDLPIRKVDRLGAQGSAIIGTFSSPDPEFDLSDAEDVHEPDIPGMFNVPDANKGEVY